MRKINEIINETSKDEVIEFGLCIATVTIVFSFIWLTSIMSGNY